MTLVDTVKGLLRIDADRSATYQCPDCEARFSEVVSDDVVCPYCGSVDVHTKGD